MERYEPGAVWYMRNENTHRDLEIQIRNINVANAKPSVETTKSSFSQSLVLPRNTNISRRFQSVNPIGLIHVDKQIHITTHDAG